ncbi:unnamed protein product [Heligmosomoides polygyrus]|uniref:CN hydrolase domain-containing protein n=1 Tax=Heligmosomoides polygyrus TaxID=6339 RepID=A0A183GUN7_HELPZ|nr:unnamed protein product [Heligmosomoides polygyrus]
MSCLVNDLNRTYTVRAHYVDGRSSGLVPYNVLCVRAGRVLAEVRSVHDVFDVKTIFELVLLAAVLVSIGLLTRRRQSALPQAAHASSD